MKSAGNRGVVQSRLQVLHVHVFLVAPLGTCPHGAASHRPASGRSCRPGMSPPPASVGGSHGSAARSRCWYGCGSSVRWENRSMSDFRFQPWPGTIDITTLLEFCSWLCAMKEMSKTDGRSSPQTGKWESKEFRASQGRKNHSAVNPAPEKGMEQADQAERRSCLAER